MNSECQMNVRFIKDVSSKKNTVILNPEPEFLIFILYVYF